MAGGASDGGRGAPGHPSASSAARRAAAGVAGAAGPPMANEGRWTDNGQPLTAAEGRTVLPMLDQVELAVAARLLPAARQTNAAATPATEQPENGEEKEGQVCLRVGRCRGMSEVVRSFGWEPGSGGGGGTISPCL